MPFVFFGQNELWILHSAVARFWCRGNALILVFFGRSAGLHCYEALFQGGLFGVDMESDEKLSAETWTDAVLWCDTGILKSPLFPARNVIHFFRS